MQEEIDPEKPLRSLAISPRYTVLFYADGRRATTCNDKPWLPLIPNTIVWDLLEFILAREKVHAPGDELKRLADMEVDGDNAQ